LIGNTGNTHGTILNRIPAKNAVISATVTPPISLSFAIVTGGAPDPPRDAALEVVAAAREVAGPGGGGTALVPGL
jgi:hypothetical protein